MEANGKADLSLITNVVFIPSARCDLRGKQNNETHMLPNDGGLVFIVFTRLMVSWQYCV